MENKLGKRSEREASLMSRYPPKDRLDFLRGYPPDMYKRRGDALVLGKIRTGGKCASEKKICVSACGGGIHQDIWQESLYGFTRVVVHGMDSICAVARTEDLDRVTRQAKKPYPYMSDMVLKNALIYEAEDLALPLDERSKMTSRSIEKPFVAVSVIPDGANSSDEASSDEYDVASAIGFVEEEINRGTTFTFDESVKTAVFTLEYLFGKRFESNEIKVFYVENHSGRVVGGRGSSEAAKEFPFRGERSIKDHLDVIKKLPHTRGSSVVVAAKP